MWMSEGCFGLFWVIVVGCMGLVLWGWFNRVGSIGFFGDSGWFYVVDKLGRFFMGAVGSMGMSKGCFGFFG